YPTQGNSQPAASYPSETPSYPAGSPSYPAETPSSPAATPEYPTQGNSQPAPTYPAETPSQPAATYPPLSTGPATLSTIYGNTTFTVPSQTAGYPTGEASSTYPAPTAIPTAGAAIMGSSATGALVAFAAVFFGLF
ncbi:hypothetical protein PC116_g29784, partial [Phytophthora cactorum]